MLNRTLGNEPKYQKVDGNEEFSGDLLTNHLKTATLTVENNMNIEDYQIMVKQCSYQTLSYVCVCMI